MNLQVFLVDDGVQVRRSLTELLASVGPFQVAGERATEAEAKLWLDENRGAWDLAVIDLVLEQGTGMGVVARARQTAPTAAIVVFSEYATPGILSHCLGLGADRVFQKSSDLPALMKFADELARRRATG